MDFEIERSSLVNTLPFPLLDFKNYLEGKDSQKEEFLKDLFLALSKNGFFILKNSGIASPILKKAEITHYFLSNMDTVCFKETKTNLVGNNFQNEAEKLFRDIESVGKILLQALSLSVDMDIQYFDNLIQDGKSVLKFQIISEDHKEDFENLKNEQKFNFLALIPNTTSFKFQVMDMEGHWLNIETLDSDLIVVSGELLTRISNNLIPTPPFKIIESETSTDRPAALFFLNPNEDALLSVIPSCRGQRLLFQDVSVSDLRLQDSH